MTVFPHMPMREALSENLLVVRKQHRAQYEATVAMRFKDLGVSFNLDYSCTVTDCFLTMQTGASSGQTNCSICLPHLASHTPIPKGHVLSTIHIPSLTPPPSPSSSNLYNTTNCNYILIGTLGTTLAPIFNVGYEIICWQWAFTINIKLDKL